MITVAYHPRLDCHNPYLRLYAGAMARHGVEPGPTLECQDRFLYEHSGRLHVLHVQWNPDLLWRPWWADTFRKRLRALGGFWTYLRRAKRLGYKLVWTLHDVERHDGDRWGDGLGYKLLARYADLCVCHDGWAAEQFVRRHRGRPDRVVVMAHGNYDGAFPAPARSRAEVLAGLELDPARPTFLCQGVVKPYKRYELAVEAFRRLGPGHQLVIAGIVADEQYGRQLETAAAGLPHVRFRPGRVSDAEVAELAHATDGFLLPYRQITGSGALLTAFTLGRGAVCSDLPYFAGMLKEDPAAGVTFPAGSVDGLCEAVTRFLAVPPAERGRAARGVADRLSWDRVVQPVVDWYRKTFPGRLGEASAPPDAAGVAVGG